MVKRIWPDHFISIANLNSTTYYPYYQNTFSNIRKSVFLYELLLMTSLAKLYKKRLKKLDWFKGTPKTN